VAGSATDSAGLVVGGNIRAGDFNNGAFAGVDAFGLTAFGSAHALNVVSIIGGVGGTGPSPLSTGVSVAGSVYATNSFAGGGSLIYVPQLLPFPVEGGTAFAVEGGAALDLLASNAVGIDGSVIADGGDGAIGVRVLGDVFASEGGAFGEAISVGSAEGLSAASGVIIASNTVSITGLANGAEGGSTGVYVGDRVFATQAAALGEAISGSPFSDANARVEVRANNVVSIVGTAGAGNIGVAVGEGVSATFAEAYGYAAANPFQDGGVANAFS
jgi:hypothetical protein